MDAMSDAGSPVTGATVGGATENSPAGEMLPAPGDSDEDNVARILRLAAKPSGLDADEAVWVATTIDQALSLLDHGAPSPIAACMAQRHRG